MPNLDLSIAKIMQGDTPVLRIMEGDTRVWPSGDDMVVDASLTNITSSISLPASVAPNSSFTVTLTPEASHIINQISVTMGGVDITSSAYNDGVITIAEVTGDVVIIASALEVITFEDAAVKAICVENWGGNVIEGEITPAEAAAVTTLDGKFYNNTTIVKFNEFRYFTGITNLYRSDNNGAVGQFYHCDNLEEITMPAANITNLGGAFRRAFSTAAKAVTVDLTPITTPSSTSIAFSGAFREAYKVAKVILPGFKSGSSWQYAFRVCSSLVEIEIHGTLDLSSVTSFSNAFYTCSKLSTISGAISGISANIDLSACPLTRDSALVILNGLATVSGKTLKFKASTTALLSAEDIAIGTAKGWTVS